MRLKITTKNKTTQKSALTSAKPQRATPAAGVEAAEKAIERELRTAGFPMEMDDLKEYVMLSHKGISSDYAAFGKQSSGQTSEEIQRYDLLAALDG